MYIPVHFHNPSIVQPRYHSIELEYASLPLSCSSSSAHFKASSCSFSPMFAAAKIFPLWQKL